MLLKIFFPRCDVLWSESTPSPHSPTATTFPRCAAASSLNPEKYCDSPLCSNSLQRVGWQPTVQKKSSTSWERRCHQWSRNREENIRICYEAVTSRPGQFQRLLAVIQASSCDHKLHKTKKLLAGAAEHILNYSSRLK